MIGPRQVLAEATCCAELVDAFRARKEALGLSNEAVEHLIPLAAGHCDKVLGPSGTRGLSQTTLDGLLNALGLKLLVAINPEQVARMRSRWQGRVQQQVRPPAKVAAALIARARPVVLRQLASKAATARWSRTTPEKRRAIMRSVWTARRNVRALNGACAAVGQANGQADR
jgi:hypothetical protein